MKLLLTSAGITNQSIAQALIDLVGKSPKDTRIGFIPTAKNVEPKILASTHSLEKTYTIQPMLV